MTYNTKKTQKGFTLIETIVAIFILTMTIGALLTLAAGGFYSVRYARNQIIAESLIQESLEYVRNDRDTNIAQGMPWTDWVKKMDVCFGKGGCRVDVYTDTNKILPCYDECKNISFYTKDGFYGYDDAIYPPSLAQGDPYGTSFVRTVTMEYSTQDPNQIIVTSTMKWLNGTSPRTTNQSIVLADWQK
jgi:type II secretory pathway pseudopilin PulG